MVVSLYICEIPKNVTKQDIENIFCEFDGYKETRMKGNDIDKRKIAFVDYESDSNARFALETLNGFKFYSKLDEGNQHPPRNRKSSVGFEAEGDKEIIRKESQKTST